MRELLRSPAKNFVSLPRELHEIKEPEITSSRELAREEVLVLLHPQNTRRPELLANKLRARHHAIARMMVAGAKDVEIGRAVGCSQQTLSLLKDSPAFMALYLEYAAMADEAAVDMKARLTAAAGLGLDEITRRLVEAPEQVPTKDLREITTNLLDRSGHGPTQKVESVNAILTLEDIRELKSRHKPSVVIDHGDTGD